MDKKLSKQFDELWKLKHKLDDKQVIINRMVQPLCDFPAVITWCEGDGFLILNEDTEAVALVDCLNGHTKINKLSAEQHGDVSL